MHCRTWVLSALLLALVGCSHTQTRGQAADELDREDPAIKDMRTVGDVTEVGDLRPKPVSGVALVGNLEGTGGGIPNGEWRKMLEDQLHKQGVKDVKALLADPNHAMVLVNVLIPPGTRKGDALDVEVWLPQQSKSSNLRGGYLYECPLYNYETTPTAQGGARMLKGHILGKARGFIHVGVGDSLEELRLHPGHIWEGAVSHIDAPFYLYLKNDQKFAKVANMVANRINTAFPDDARKQYLVRQTKKLLVLDEVASGINEKFRSSSGLGSGEAAQAVSKDVIRVNVPVEYHLNPERYLRVIRLIPLRESPETAAKYRQRLHDMLLEPKETIRAALRLEAMGKESIPALKKGLTSEVVLVRFASAEALAYLGCSNGMEELGRLAEIHDTLRGNCLTAMASLNESAAHAQLAKLMHAPKAETRVGAFRALRTLTEAGAGISASAHIRGELLNNTFWLHHVPTSPTPLVHVATQRQAEIVAFGDAPSLVPPLRIAAGPEFSITAAAGDDRCTITRYMESAGKVLPKQCSFKVEDILRAMASMGGQYPDAVEFLRQADRAKCLTCSVIIDAFPGATPIEVLAACGSDANKFKDNPVFQQEVLAAQEDLGMLLAQPHAPVGQARAKR